MKFEPEDHYGREDFPPAIHISKRTSKVDRSWALNFVYESPLRLIASRNELSGKYHIKNCVHVRRLAQVDNDKVISKGRVHMEFSIFVSCKSICVFLRALRRARQRQREVNVIITRP